MVKDPTPTDEPTPGDEKARAFAHYAAFVTTLQQKAFEYAAIADEIESAIKGGEAIWRVELSVLAEIYRAAEALADGWRRAGHDVFKLTQPKRKRGRPRNSSVNVLRDILHGSYKPPGKSVPVKNWAPERARIILKLFEDARRDLEARTGKKFREKAALRAIDTEFRTMYGKSMIGIESSIVRMQKTLDKARKTLDIPPVRRSRRVSKKIP